MEPAKTHLSINLLSQDDFSSSIIGKLLLWALSIGRYIVVFTELIVILSFLSRFKLDRDLTDLNSDIAKQKAVIESYGNLEANVRRVQGQLEIVRQRQSQPSPKVYLDLLQKIMPPEVRLQQLSIETNSIKISAISITARGIGQFIQSLSKEPSIKNIMLSSVATAEDKGGITFEIKADLGEKEVEKPAKSTKAESEDL